MRMTLTFVLYRFIVWLWIIRVPLILPIVGTHLTYFKETAITTKYSVLCIWIIFRWMQAVRGKWCLSGMKMEANQLIPSLVLVQKTRHFHQWTSLVCIHVTIKKWWEEFVTKLKIMRIVRVKISQRNGIGMRVCSIWTGIMVSRRK